MPQFRLPNSSGGIAWRSRRKIHASAALISLRLSAAFTPFSLSFFINKNNSSGNSSIRGFRIFKNFFLQPQQRRHRHIGLRRKQQQTNNNIPRHRRNILLFPLALGPSEVSSLESKYHAQVLDKDDISSHLEQIRNLDLINETKSSSSTVLSHTLHTTWRHIQLILRAVKISIIFTPAIITFPIWYLSNRRQLLTSNYTGAAYKPTIDSSSFSDHPGKHNHRHDWWIHLLVMSIEQAGASFIKIGQWASSRRDLFPASICTALGKLQDRVQAHSIKDTQDAVLAAFGLPINQVFSKFNYEPVGVGAIAQVIKNMIKI